MSGTTLMGRWGSRLNRIRDEDLLLDNILELIDLHLHIDLCSLMVLDPRTNALCIKKAVGMDDVDISGIRVPVGEGIAGYVAAGTRPLLIRDISTDPHLVRRETRKNPYTTNSLLSVPLVAEGRVIGVINVNNRKDGLSFTEEDQALLTAISSKIALVLQRSYMKLQLKKNKTLDEEINRFMV
ncbi:MAG: GAF domain-containing protein [Desulfobacterium sp.]|nr:GAF domain-containing protein [Desulfobacterium sp.]